MYNEETSPKKSLRVEKVLLVIVLLSIAAICGWLFYTSWQSEQAAIKAAEQKRIEDKTQRIKIVELGVSFKIPKDHGKISLEWVENEKSPTAFLSSTKLQRHQYDCKGDNEGIFGYLKADETGDFGPQPQYTKEIKDRTIGFYNGLTKACYSDELLKEFRDTVPKAIVESIEEIK